MTLRTPRLLLRPFTPADTAAVLRACQDPEIQRWTTIPSPYREEHATGFVTDIGPRGWAEDTVYTFGTFTLDGGRLVSSVAVRRGHAGVDEIGYWTAPEQRGRGYTAEAVVAVARWAFTTVGTQRLEWLATVGNAGSRAVAERAGFVVEGTLRARVEDRGGRRDAWIGALLPADLGLAPAAAR